MGRRCAGPDREVRLLGEGGLEEVPEAQANDQHDADDAAIGRWLVVVGDAIANLVDVPADHPNQSRRYIGQN